MTDGVMKFWKSIFSALGIDRDLGFSRGTPPITPPRPQVVVVVVVVVVDLLHFLSVAHFLSFSDKKSGFGLPPSVGNNSTTHTTITPCVY